MKRIRYLFAILIMFFAVKQNVFAGSLSVWANANTVTVGSNVTISVNAKNVFGTFSIKSSDSQVLSGPGSGDIDNETKTYTFSAKKAGTATITIVPTDMADYDNEGKYSESKSVTIRVVNANAGGSSSGGTTKDKKTYSQDNSLKSLSVEGQSITPEFDKDKTEYKLELDQEIEKINIKAEANDSKAEVSGAGEKNLSFGENTFEIKVTAENGNEKIYKLIVNVIDKDPIIIKIGNKEYTLVKKNNNLIDKLENYEEEKITINDKEVVAYTNKNNKITLVILKDSEGKYAYYIYDNGEYTRYIETTFTSLKLLILEMPKNFIPKNYKKYTFKYNDEKYEGYKLNKSNKSYLIYAKNLENGEKDLYLYDNTIKGCVLYDETQDKYYQKIIEKNSKKFMYIIIGLLSVYTLILIIMIIKSNKRKVKF